jgi:hypothetical protein
VSVVTETSIISECVQLINAPEGGDADAQRITAAVRRAADLAFQARFQSAIERRLRQRGLNGITRQQREERINSERWDALRTSTRAAASPGEFQAFARVLGISPQWLAIGIGGYEAPPVGWHDELEFSNRLDEGGMPKWERVAL